MKTKTIEIDGNSYQVSELTMEIGLPMISSTTGVLDTAGLIRAATTINGVPAKEGEISFGVALKLLPIVMEFNSFAGGKEGNE